MPFLHVRLLLSFLLTTACSDFASEDAAVLDPSPVASSSSSSNSSASVSSNNSSSSTSSSSSSQQADSFKINSIQFLSGNNVSPISFPRTNIETNQISSLELPPVMLGDVNGINYSIVASFESFLCATGLGFSSPFQYPNHFCRLISTPVVDSSRRTYSFSSSQISAEAPWRRNYVGVFSAHQIDVARVGPSLVSIVHYENKGELAPYAGQGAGFFPNTYAPNMTNTVEALSDGNCTEKNACYFGGVGIQWRKLSELLANQPSDANNDIYDLGPITWPSAGYATSDRLIKISAGPIVPFSIIKGGYIYVYYVDYVYTNGLDGNFSKYDVEGRKSGVKVIRAPISNFAPAQWKAYWNGKFSEPTLPTGFDPNKVLDFVSKQGPRATPVVSDPTSYTMSFTVAKIKNTSSYIAAEVYVDYLQHQCASPGQIKVALRTSENLVTWSSRVDVYGCLDRPTFGLTYAKFLDSTGNNNYEIDPNDFYLIGNSTFFSPDANLTKNYSTPLNTLRLKILQ